MSIPDLVTRINTAKNELRAARNELRAARNTMLNIISFETTSGFKPDSYVKSDEALIRMHQEMIGNLDDIDKMKFLNSRGALGKPLALIEFAHRVRQGGEWDHKPLLRDELELNPDGEPGKTGDEDWHFPIRGNSQVEYNYDIWSNIHYGYVGSAAGFSSIELRGGAMVADGFKNIPADDLSVQIGIELWEEHGENLTDEQLRQAIIDQTDEYLKVQNEENIVVITAQDEEFNFG